ncbi:hypothetical protein BLNAU_5521 [Blattamonas nauphoetae]|uniref:Uncharacterized protein n=1 Tax=Blattamonas nauphoetae TaxID=2049346 RepID=A0ABQ9Y6S9_9EUKA|nr:hypothetical protein BLNAU_5521 [Blattamonas nauphoetae]
MNEKWTACIVYGKDQHTDSFTFLPSLKDRKAQIFQKNLPWLIPVIVCSVLLLLVLFIVVVVLICRRKKQAASSNTDKTFTEQELAEEDVVKMEVEATMAHSTENVIGEKSDEDGRFGLMQHHPSPTIEHANVTAKEGNKMGTQVEAMKCHGDFGTVLVNDANTLYNTLHKEHTNLGPKKGLIQRQIVMGLQKIAEQHTFLNVAAKISSHWIMLDATTSVFLKIDSQHCHLDQNPTNAASMSSTTSPPNNQHIKDGVEEIL